MILPKIEFEFSKRTKKIMFAVAVVAMAMPAASEYMSNVVVTDVDCNVTYKGQVVHIEKSQFAPSPTNASFFYSDDAGWMKETETTDKTCKELKK